jgi:hypothetical protein
MPLPKDLRAFAAHWGYHEPLRERMRNLIERSLLQS